MEEIKDEIKDLGLGEMSELNSHLVSLMKARRSVKAKQKIKELQEGDKVEFEHAGKTIEGTVKEVKRKRATVRVGHKTYDVNAALLKKQT